ncbi:zeta toxin family protein [Rhodococcus zopfii]
MSDFSSSREAVAAQLADLSAPDAPLNTDSPLNTTRLYAVSVRRRVFRKTVIDRYLDSTPMPPREGRSALITAGPPGAGKSTLLSRQIADLQDYRRLDADEVKDHLIRQAVTDGIYGDLLERPLADGHPIAPRELAALVHHESTALIDQIRRICTDRQENVLIEGTLRWPDHGQHLLAELAAADYTSVRVIGVEVPRARPRTSPTAMVDSPPAVDTRTGRAGRPLHPTCSHRLLLPHRRPAADLRRQRRSTHPPPRLEQPRSHRHHLPPRQRQQSHPTRHRLITNPLFPRIGRVGTNCDVTLFVQPCDMSRWKTHPETWLAGLD